MRTETVLPRHRADVPPELVEGSVWLLFGFVALCVTFAALAVLFDYGASAAKAMPLSLGGAAASYFAFRRSWRLVSRDDAAPLEPTARGSAIVRTAN